jgi:tetratricopeptide (TPR) repeat protein
MKTWTKRILKISGISFLILVLVALGILYYQRHDLFFLYYAYTKQTDKAASYMTRVIERDPDNLKLRIMRYLVLFPKVKIGENNQDICETVIEDCNKIMELDPKLTDEMTKHRNKADASIHFHQSMEHYQKGDLEKAAEDYMAAYKLFPDRPLEEAPDFPYIYVLSHHKEYDKSIKFYTIYVERFPEVGLAYYFRGQIYAEKDDHEKALADFDSAIELIGDHRDYEYSNIYRSKAELCEKLGKIEAAIEAYRGFVEGDFESVPDAHIEEAKERIKALEEI